jgi:predicted GNAT family acetyltransferase
MKKTAVIWLIEELTKNGHNFKLYKKEIEQAKEMEKQQIIDACNNAQKTDFYVKYYDAEQYYNETFKNK